MPTATPDPSLNESRLVTLITDGETGLLNGIYFRLRLEEEFKKSWRFGWTLSLLVMDVSGLDAVEQVQGRAAADAVVLDIAGEVLTASRDVDLSARLGRSRFAMLLPGTPDTGARTMVQRVMNGLLDRLGNRVSLAVGLTCAPREGLVSADEFLARAERGLVAAASQGPNQVATWNAPSA